MISVTHIITDLDVGGAEMVLLRLLERIDPTETNSEVISLSRGGALVARLARLGVRVTELGPSPLSARNLPRLVRSLRRDPPDVVQTWMYHADLLGGVAARLAGCRRIAWGLHAASLPPEGTGLKARWGLSAAARLSYRIPLKIVCCSEASRDAHAGFGYDVSRMRVISNGFETAERPADAAHNLRSELGIESGLLVGRVGRYHEVKDHETFLDAAARISRERLDVHFVLVGDGITPENLELGSMIRVRGLEDRTHLLGRRNDMVAVTAALDVSVSSSRYGEALPLVLGEAMSLGVPVVATDVGDSARLIDDRARVAPPGDAAALARAILGVLALEPGDRLVLGTRDRDRIAERYSLTQMVQSYSDLHLSLAR